MAAKGGENCQGLTWGEGTRLWKQICKCKWYVEVLVMGVEIGDEPVQSVRQQGCSLLVYDKPF